MSRSSETLRDSRDSVFPEPKSPFHLCTSSGLDQDIHPLSENDQCANRHTTFTPNKSYDHAHCINEQLSQKCDSVTFCDPVFANVKPEALTVKSNENHIANLPGDVENSINQNNLESNKPAEEDKMGNVFGRKKKKKEKELKIDEDSELWKRRNTNESTSSSCSGKNKNKDNKKSKSKNKHPESPSITRAKSNSLKGKDSRDRYAIYEPDKQVKKGNCHTLPARVNKSNKNAASKSVRADPSEFRKSIGDPMDFKMADDVSSAGSPGYATPDTATPTATRTALFRNLNQRDVGIDHTGQNTPRQTPKLTPKLTPIFLKKEKASESSDDSKYSTGKASLTTPSPSLTPKFSPLQKRKIESNKFSNNVPHNEGLTGSPRPRGYILPSPPTRPKFVNKGAVNDIPDSPKLFRSGKHRLHADDVLLEKSGSVKEKLIGCCEIKEIPIYQCINKTSVKDITNKSNKNLKDGSESKMNLITNYTGGSSTAQKHNEPASVDIQVEDENEVNIRKEELRKMAFLSAGCATEECQNIRETMIESIQPNLIDNDKFEVTAGPKIAVLSTIPPPEKAVLSLVPPPSPSSMGVLCEEEEHEKDEEEEHILSGQISHRMSKDVEEFGDIVCQRLSQLLESQEDDGSLRTHGNTRLVPTSDSISPQSPGMIYQRGGGTDSDTKSDSSNMQSENVYKEKQILETIQVMEIRKPPVYQCSLEQPTMIAKCPRGEKDVSVMDMANNNYRLETNRDIYRQQPGRNRIDNQVVEDTGSESDISSSETSYTSESENTSDCGLGLQDEDKEPSKDETVYSVPWDLNRYRTDSNTDEGLDFCDDLAFEQSENVARSIDISQCSVERNHPTCMADSQRNICKKYLKTIGTQSSCDSVGEQVLEPSESTLKQQALAKHLKEIFDMRYTSMESVNEQHIEPTSIKRELNLPKHFTREESECEVIEEEIKPRYSDSSDKMCINRPKRESDILCDVIDAYTGDDVSEKRKSVKQKVQDFENLTVEQMAEAKKPSALDKSIQRIFLEQEVEELYPELAPLHSLIQDAMDKEPSNEPYPCFKEGDFRQYSHLPLAHKRFGSSTFTESDLDMSEQRDDVSSDSMDADDEDEEGGLDDESKDSEALFSKPFSENVNGGKLLVKRAVLSSHAFRETVSETDNDSVFLDEDDMSHSDHRHWRQRDIPSPEEYDHQRWRSEDLSSVDDFAYDHREHEHRQWQQEEAPPTPLSAPPFFTIPPPPPQPPSPSFSDDHRHHLDLDLASTYHAMGPPVEVADVAFDDARKQMEDIHVHLQNLRDQISHLHDDDDVKNRSRRRDVHDPRRVYTD